MRYQSVSIINAVDSANNITGSKLDVNQVVNMSVQIIGSGASVAGVLKLQASNDTPTGDTNRGQFTPTNWVDITNATATVAGTTQQLINLTNIAYGYVRAIWTKDVGGSTGTLTCKASTVGA